jgi:hypothetical protein
MRILRILERGPGLLAAASLLLAGCAASLTHVGPGDTLRIGPDESMAGTNVGGKAPPVICGGSIVALLCLPLAAATASHRESDGLTSPLLEGAPVDRAALLLRMRALGGMVGMRGVDDWLVEAVRKEASSRWRVSDNAATSLDLHVEHLSTRVGEDGGLYVHAMAAATLRQGGNRTGNLLEVAALKPLRDPRWRDDPEVFAEVMREVCRDLSRQIVQQLSR